MITQAESMASVDIMPAMPMHALSPIHSTTPLPAPDTDSASTTELARSASFSYLTGLSKENPAKSMKRVFSDNVLSVHSNNDAKVTETMQTANRELFRRSSKKMKNRLSAAIFSLSAEDDDLEKETSKTDTLGADSSKSANRSVAGSIRNFARKSWIASSSRPSSRPASRSTSPSPKDDQNPEGRRSRSPTKKLAALTITSVTVPEPAASSPTSRSSQQTIDSGMIGNDVQIRMLPRQEKQNPQSQRPVSVIMPRNKSESSLKRLSKRSSLSSLKTSSGMASQVSLSTIVKVPPLPTSMSTDKLSAFHLDSNKRKDPLWSAFRNIEGEYNNFQSKTTLQKVKVLRMSLLPFLSKYAHHPSDNILRAEDLDRRVVILNKWWSGLLEMLNGQNNQSITGTDRPTFLEAAAGIMMRPEWRIPRYPSISSETTRPPSVTRSKSNNSLQSNESDFLVESIHQNVRNIFVQNLLSQMVFVVEKLSMRSAPASLITFCGKACAYAFFYCPGVADMLTRLWRLPAGTLRRIFHESGVSQGDRLDILSKGVLPSFPTPVRSLAVKSQAALGRHLQQRGQIPPGTESVPWFGPWNGRWSGRDSDLLFVFTKFYHLLVSEFLPEGFSAKERACIPGFVPLHAQLLTILETTLYRQAGQHFPDNYAAGTTADLDAIDAAAPLPMTIANASRSIGENRLVMLLRDILSGQNPDNAPLRSIFASAFGDTIKAATRRISLYNNDTCFVLCDFMEEVLPIMSRYSHAHVDSPVFDWPFWLEVGRQMMQSQTTLTQIRQISFVYTMWLILVSNEERRREVVLDWLLNPEFFYQHFCHWSPMVRHYFYRLLCWRVARCDRSPTPLDIEILETLSLRLNTCWAHYQYLQAEAEMRELCPPSSAPCSPAPSRQLIIIRTDSHPISASAFTSFDRFLSPGLGTQNTPYDTKPAATKAVAAADQSNQNGNRKRWSIFKSIMPFNSTPGNSRPGEVTPPTSPDQNIVSKDGTSSPVQPISRPVTPPHQALSFRFSLEFIETRPNISNKNKKLKPPFMPVNAQRVLDERRQSQDSASDTSVNSSAQASTRSKSSLRSGEVRPVKPLDSELACARYTGRALAEWIQVLTEHKNFYARRKTEGVPRDGLVECVALGVETLRIIG